MSPSRYPPEPLVQGHVSATAFMEGVPSSELRRVIRLQRRQQTPLAYRTASDMTCQHIRSSRPFLKARSLALYLPNDGELDLAPLLAVAWARGKHCHLPILDRIIKRRLFFAPYRTDTPLQLNRFGIAEPDIHPRRLVHPLALDLILLPLVAFDLEGHRIGMGGGYYDRTLAYLRKRKHWQRPTLMGIAFDFQKVGRIHPRPWDIPLQAIATPSGIHYPMEIKK